MHTQRRGKGRQEQLWLRITELVSGPGHPFYKRLPNQLLDSEEVRDEFCEAECAQFYAENNGRPSLTPGTYFQADAGERTEGIRFRTWHCVAGGRSGRARGSTSDTWAGRTDAGSSRPFRATGDWLMDVETLSEGFLLGAGIGWQTGNWWKGKRVGIDGHDTGSQRGDAIDCAGATPELATPLMSFCRVCAERGGPRRRRLEDLARLTAGGRRRAPIKSGPVGMMWMRALPG